MVREKGRERNREREGVREAMRQSERDRLIYPEAFEQQGSFLLLKLMLSHYLVGIVQR